MSETPAAATDHGVIGGGPSIPPPLGPVPDAPRLSAAEEARTLVVASTVGALATLTGDGDPWASLVTYGALPDGNPVLCLSRMAEHGRNVMADARASLVVSQRELPSDPLAAARVTLAGRVRRAGGDSGEEARAVHLAAVPSARTYIDFSDFSLWILEVERVRWVGGYGRMDSVSAEHYASAAPDPVSERAPGAVAHLNADHGDALLLIAAVLAGYPDAVAADCTAIDRYGIDLSVETARGRAPARVAFAAPLSAGAELRGATVELTRRAQAAAAAASA